MSRSVGGFSNSGHLSLRAVVQSCLFEANSYLQSCKFARNNDPLGGDFRVQFRPPSYLHANCAMPDRRECALDRVRGAQMRPMLGGKIKERQQRIAVLEQAIDGFVVFGQPAPTCLLLAPRRTSAQVLLQFQRCLMRDFWRPPLNPYKGNVSRSNRSRLSNVITSRHPSALRSTGQLPGFSSKD